MKTASATTESFWDEVEARLDARDARVVAFVAAHDGRPFKAGAAARSGATHIIVSPSFVTAGTWRLTRFDAKGPYGHTECGSYREAVHEAAREYGVDLDLAEF